MTKVEEIDRKLREAIRARDLRTADVLRMIKTRLTERRTAPGFTGGLTDAIVVEIVATYAKQLEKALIEYQAVGARGAEMCEQLRFEIDYCRQFLPGKLGEAESGELVRAAVAATGAKDVKEAGKVVGHVMKTAADKSVLDAALLKRLTEDLLRPAG